MPRNSSAKGVVLVDPRLVVEDKDCIATSRITRRDRFTTTTVQYGDSSRGIAGQDAQRLDQVLEYHIILGQRGEVQQPDSRQQDVLTRFKGKSPIEDARDEEYLHRIDVHQQDQTLRRHLQLDERDLVASPQVTLYAEEFLAQGFPIEDEYDVNHNTINYNDFLVNTFIYMCSITDRIKAELKNTHFYWVVGTRNWTDYYEFTSPIDENIFDPEDELISHIVTMEDQLFLGARILHVRALPAL
ncbi:uncharacterized protein FFB14_15280 [Fusarium fujikuroi]|nr:uncharacterized protein FFB14_15280 [Fusarium fujikuroi]